MLGNALEIFRRIGDKRNAGYCLGNMGTIYRSQAKFSAALGSFEDSVQIFSEIGDEHALTYSIGNIGDVQLRMGKLKEAKRRYDQTLAAAKRLGDEELESETLSRFGTYYLLSCQLEQSETYLKKALALAERIGSNEFVMKALAGLTELELHMSRHQDALKTSQRLLTTAQDENMQEYVARGYLLRGRSRAALRAVQQAESDLKKAQEISAEVGFPEISYQVHLELAKLSHSLSAAAGKKHSIAAEDQLTQAQKNLEDIASQIEERGDREAFLNNGMAELRSSVGKLGLNAPSAPKVHA
jgi:tetratricopeptide (TPR) repeat protein